MLTVWHVLVLSGRQYDGRGRLRDWWDPMTAEMFNETTPCMRDQYDHYKIGNMTVGSGEAGKHYNQAKWFNIAFI